MDQFKIDMKMKITKDINPWACLFDIYLQKKEPYQFTIEIGLESC